MRLHGFSRGYLGALYNDQPQATSEEIQAMGSMHGMGEMGSWWNGAGAAPPVKSLSSKDRLQAAGLNLFDRVASGQPLFTVGAQADLGSGAKMAAIVAAIAPVVLVLGVAYMFFNRKRG